MRPTSCEIDLSAVTHNVRTLRALVAPTPICAVVKANGYGHGAVSIAKAALSAGASWLAVALVEEGLELRRAGIDAPILLLSEPPLAGMDAVIDHSLTPTVYSARGIAALAEAALGRGPVAVHLCIDSGMRRVGAELAEISDVAELVTRFADLRLEAIWTHCPVADEPDNNFTSNQLDRFASAVAAQAGGMATHVANSAVALSRPSHAAMMVRCGISMYGIDPAPALTGLAELRPAMTLRSAVAFVKTIRAGEGVGYGHRFVAEHDTTIATVPIGYADGVRRDLGLAGGSVLIGGQKHPIVGVVTMDQLMVDVGRASVEVGDDVVVMGTQESETITAADIAATLNTIPYEVVCAVSDRVPRVHLPVN